MSISRIVFAGRDANDRTNLGVTTRTSAGTVELTVAGANAGGLGPKREASVPFSGQRAIAPDVFSKRNLEFYSYTS